MAKRKRKKKGQLSLRLGLNDERIPKLIGTICLFFALIFLLAFLSYLFTWRIDQDKVTNFEWAFFWSQDFQVANWLGRFGALVSHFFFYNGFGLPSFLVIFMLGLLGVSLIRRAPLSSYVPTLGRTFVVMLILSVFFHFVFQGSGFPWGGAFGELVSEWLQSFLGQVGFILLFMLVIMATIVWMVNPNFRELTPEQAWKETQGYLGERFQKALPGGARGKTKSKAVESLDRVEELEARDEKRLEEKEQNASTTVDLAAGTGERKMTIEEANQLAFDLETENEPRKPLAPSAGQNLEIQQPKADEPGPSGIHTNPVLRQEGNHNHTEPYDPTLELSTYEHPVLALLKDYSDQKVEIDRAELEANKDQIIETLLHYKIEIVKIRATIGPTVTLYEIVPAPGVRISKIKNLEDDIALSLAALGIRIIAPIPGKGTIGIEVPNKKKQIVSLREVLASEKFKHAKMDLPIALGKTINNEVFVADLAKMPHLLMAGATGQGKSVGINAIIMSLLYKKHPSQLKLVLIDPKKVELFPYSQLQHHFLTYLPDQPEPITTETNRVVYTLNSLCIEMDQRYNLLKKAHARNIREYNEKFVQRRLNPEKGHRFMPFIVLVIDEFADLIMTAGKEIELPIGRLAQLARAVGIHLIIATQRPSVNIITGVIKANFPARIAYKVSAKVDSRTILDAGGAEQLIGRGDMLLNVGGEMLRLQCAFVDTPEVENVIAFIAGQPGYPEPYLLPEFHGDDEEIQGAGGLKYSELDEMFEDAARLIVSNQHGSTSMIQRRLKLGYNRAGRIMDQLEAMGIVGPAEGSKAREVLVYDERELEKYLDDLRNRNN